MEFPSRPGQLSRSSSVPRTSQVHELCHQVERVEIRYATAEHQPVEIADALALHADDLAIEDCVPDRQLAQQFAEHSEAIEDVCVPRD